MPNMTQLVKVNIPEDSRQVAKVEAARRGITIAEFVAQAIEKLAAAPPVATEK